MKNLETVVIGSNQKRRRQYRDVINPDSMKSGEKYMYHYGYLPMDRDVDVSDSDKASRLDSYAASLIARSSVNDVILYQNAVNGYEFEYWVRKK